MLIEKGLTFEKASAIAINFENTEASNRIMQPQHQFSVRRSRSRSQSKPNKKFSQSKNYSSVIEKTCFKCGFSHYVESII